MEILSGYTPDYHQLLGQINYVHSSHSGCVGGWLANAIIFKALKVTVDDFFVDVGCGSGVLVNAICIKFQQMDAVGIDNSVD